MNKVFFQYRLIAEMLCIGERMKKGTFRPCVKTIPFSSIVGALKDEYGFKEGEIFAAGYLEATQDNQTNKIEQMTMAPQYVDSGVSRVPLTVEFIINVKAKVYLLGEKDLIEKRLGEKFSITMGALKSKGFGRCKLSEMTLVEDLTIKKGELLTRIPEEHLDKFCIEKLKKPVYGYLFKPTSLTEGVYVKSLFERSLVKGYNFIVGGVE